MANKALRERARALVLTGCLGTGLPAYFLIRGLGFSAGTVVWIAVIAVFFASVGIALWRDARDDSVSTPPPEGR